MDTISKGRMFRSHIESRYPFGEFALIRSRGNLGEVGFVLADEDAENWPSLYREAWEIASYFRLRIKELGLDNIAMAGVGRDLDFITVSIVVDMSALEKEEIEKIADQVMGILREANPYNKGGGINE
ncbi:hypothetical protein [Candidatus Sordicultor fermentans]|uniref:hypothetical protein n=1 Tax=Candidatus Sordicultor fermentans TaxID=1953203 RepID=UPI0016B90FE9|nr:hypothetical protein [Candidatus Atribacteria bacterium]